MDSRKKNLLFAATTISILTVAVFCFYFSLFKLKNKTPIASIVKERVFSVLKNNPQPEEKVIIASLPELKPETPKTVHLPTPKPMRGIYMTSCVAGLEKWRANLISLIEETELNAVIIDIKDFSGTISFKTDNPLFKDIGQRCVAKDMKEFIDDIHKKGIYAIGRITVFQDPVFTKKRPDLAVKRKNGSVWKDRKGLSFVDAGAREFWDYIIALSQETYDLGFDELNYDYIRFPSDGNMKDIYYTFSDEAIKADPENGKAKVIRDFFSYLNEKMKDTGAVLSADLFGMAATNKDDMNIGQLLEYAEPYFDYLSPMVYPSHYPAGFIGIKDVNAHPYDIVKYSMDKASDRLTAASSTPDKLRPWLQDFKYPVVYTAAMVRAQKQAVYDAGLDSWMLWSPSNKYTRGALDK